MGGCGGRYRFLIPQRRDRDKQREREEETQRKRETDIQRNGKMSPDQLSRWLFVFRAYSFTNKEATRRRKRSRKRKGIRLGRGGGRRHEGK